MKQDKPYTVDYFKLQSKSSLSSAKVIVPLIIKLVKPKSVIDVGCGVGAWLNVFQKNGIKDILGIDGRYVDLKMLLVRQDKFMGFDLSKLLKLNREFDLAISLEVAEHLPPDRANILINSLTRLAPVIVFSAAIPSQTGIGHLNEQWPEYWRNKFIKKGYLLIDCLRYKIWNNNNVDWWYAQNLFVYIRRNLLHNYPELDKEYKNRKNQSVSLVHPKCYLNIVNNYPRSIKSLSERLVKRVVAKIGGK